MRFSTSSFSVIVIAFTVAAAVLLILKLPVEAAEKTTIGAVEEVILLPWGVKILARVDTGAAESSLDVCEYTIEGKFVSFTLADRCGGAKVRLPIVGRRHVQSALGRGRRPVVDLEICVGNRKIRTPVTLTDRSRLEFPFLIGRKALEGNFVVDVSRNKTVPPDCPERRSP